MIFLQAIFVFFQVQCKNMMFLTHVKLLASILSRKLANGKFVTQNSQFCHYFAMNLIIRLDNTLNTKVA